jgi:hypothetical protein
MLAAMLHQRLHKDDDLESNSIGCINVHTCRDSVLEVS